MKLSEPYEKEHRTEGKIRSAMLYPKILIFMMIFLVVCLSSVIPTLEPLLKGVKPPLLTRTLMEISPFSVSIPIFSSGSSTDPFHGLEISDHETCGQAFVRQDAVCTAGPGKTGENDLHGEIL